MWEIYWLTRLNGIFQLCEVSAIIFTVIILICGIGIIIAAEEKDVLKYIIKTFKVSIIPFILSVLGLVFVPTTSEALLIFGLGGTIDYLKTNDKVQQLPDKCINALDAWVETLNKKEDK